MFYPITKVEFNGTVYEQQHGNWFDRGAADSFYGRRPVPHRGGVGGNSGPRLNASEPNEVELYMAGYNYNEQSGEKKQY